MSGKTTEAVLSDGSSISYVLTDNPPRGGMKHTYFTPDRSHVVQFFNDPENAQDGDMQDRLEAILGRYNPTVSERAGGAKGNTDQTAAYFRDLYCWPKAIVRSPEFGIVSPAYPQNFLFSANAAGVPELDLAGSDKKSKWFTSSKLRRLLNKNELGDFRSMLRVSTSLARAIRRLHTAGLAHSDLSHNNVLIDPQRGDCVVIDIDSLVVPNMYPPEVAGTRGYIAPEVLATSEYDRDDPRRMLPRIETDLHSLAVLVYEYLLMRHPLEGPKIYSSASTEEDDFLGMGAMATFIENPADTSNRPDDLDVTIDDLGAGLRRLFLRAFVDGLHSPEERPAAIEWERELERALDLLHPCPNPDCTAGWFVMDDTSKGTCPHCGATVPKQERMQLLLRRPSGKPGQWRADKVLTLYDGLTIYRWHVYSKEAPNERADWTRQGRIVRDAGSWYLVNENITGLRSPKGSPVPQGHAVELKDGVQFLMSEQENGRLAHVTGA